MAQTALHARMEMPQKEQIKDTIDTLYNEVFANGRYEILEQIVEGPYIQHNPLFPNGTEVLAGFLKNAGSLPNEVKRVAIDGDLAFVHVRYPNWNGQEHAGVDIFRFNDSGKIVEHWDVLQPTPSEAANSNSMF